MSARTRPIPVAFNFVFYAVAYFQQRSVYANDNHLTISGSPIVIAKRYRDRASLPWRRRPRSERVALSRNRFARAIKDYLQVAREIELV